MTNRTPVGSNREPGGTWFDKDEAIAITSRWDYSGEYCAATRDKWSQEVLFLTRKQNWIKGRFSQRQNSSDSMHHISVEEAARWITDYAEQDWQEGLPPAMLEQILALISEFEI